MKRLRVIGVGPGAGEYILPLAKEKANECDLLFGSERALAHFSGHHQRRMEFCQPLATYLPLLQAEPTKQKGVVVAGDPGFYSLLRFLREHFPPESLEVIPGISSVQYLFAKIARPWQNFHLTSFHGREMTDVATLIAQYPGLALLTDGTNSPSFICQTLYNAGYGHCQVVVGEMLSYPDERITMGTVREIAMQQREFQMAVVIIYDQSNKSCC